MLKFVYHHRGLRRHVTKFWPEHARSISSVDFFDFVHLNLVCHHHEVDYTQHVDISLSARCGHRISFGYWGWLMISFRPFTIQFCQLISIIPSFKGAGNQATASRLQCGVCATNFAKGHLGCATKCCKKCNLNFFAVIYQKSVFFLILTNKPFLSAGCRIAGRKPSVSRPENCTDSGWSLQTDSPRIVWDWGDRWRAGLSGNRTQVSDSKRNPKHAVQRRRSVKTSSLQPVSKRFFFVFVPYSSWKVKLISSMFTVIVWLNTNLSIKRNTHRIKSNKMTNWP